MRTNGYDAIVVGARCAGSPTAMLLAREGYKVLLVDRATFPSDTISTQLIHPPAVGRLARWGLLDRLVATGCPPIDRYIFDFGPLVIAGRPGNDETPVAYAPRRTVLDKLLVDGAAEAGAEVREGFTVEEILMDDGHVTGIRGHGRDGVSVTEHARVVVGADGKHSVIAAAVGPEQYNERPTQLAWYYAYWSGVPAAGFEAMARGSRIFGAFPTNDDLTLIGAAWPYAEFDENRKDIEGNHLRSLELEPEFAERVRAGKRETRFVGTTVPNYFRKPFGPGWVLVGDAGYTKDPVTAQGIHDAFRGAELLTTALDDALKGSRTFDEALSDYQRTRDEDVLPMYEYTLESASLEEPPPEVLEVLAAVAQNQDSMDDYIRMEASAISPVEFFSEENIGRIMSRAAQEVSR